MMAFQDGLTGLYNRAAFMEEQKQIDRNRKKYQNVICICADVNNLKQINDEDGHLIGDQVLCRVTIACSQEKRWRHVPNELTIECMSIKRQ